MKAFLVAVALLISVIQPAMAACTVETAKVLRHVPFFSKTMIIHEKDGNVNDGTITYRHADDPRLIASFTMVQSSLVGSVSRNQHVSSLDALAKARVNKIKSEGRWAEKSIFPYDPVAWRVVEETVIDGVGKALVGHMEMRVTPQCILVSDFIAPASDNLKSRWIEMVDYVAKIRDYSSAEFVYDTWLAEDTTPTGLKGILAGFGSPLLVIAVFSYVVYRSRQLDQPSLYTKIVLGVCGLISLGALLYQLPAYQAAVQDNFVEMKHIDSLMMLLFIGGACITGIIRGYEWAIVGFTASGIGGFALVVSSYLGWTPDPVIGFVVGGALILLGLLAFAAWDNMSKLYRRKQKHKASLTA